MCERLAAYIEGDLSPDEQARAEQHLSECETCAQALVELRAIAGEAAQLPSLTPSRDLWAGIEARISTPITLLDHSPANVRRAPQRQWQYAIAAAALIAVGAGATYLIAVRPGTTVSRAVSVATHTPPPTPDTQRSPSTAPTQASPIAPITATASNVSLHKKAMSATRVYDHELSLLDSLVRTRRGSLDPKTVTIIEQNLKIIDKAIAESRAALAKDPKSPLLTNQLDNVLGSKVELLRTVAFLPTRS
ncbi:MAG: zf-HC2 domain-containing protein [Gemmatimonadota bacterium]|nr:zf-HC2 domain-containing protein [Gemmatimonadota bacterium]